MSSSYNTQPAIDMSKAQETAQVGQHMDWDWDALPIWCVVADDDCDWNVIETNPGA